MAEQGSDKDGAEGRYHHGALRQALLSAAEAELSESGIESFSLRKVARRAGVSHAAPAHHFGNTDGLLTALATIGFRRLVHAMDDAAFDQPPDPASQLVGAGLGYIRFAADNPALFRLIFASIRPEQADEELAQAGEDAFDHLVAKIQRLRGADPYQDPQAMRDVSAAWAMVHGLADLLVSGRLGYVGQVPEPQRSDILVDLIRRSVPLRSGAL